MELRSWTDLTGTAASHSNLNAQVNEIGPSPNKNFGTLADAATANVKDRPGQWEYNVAVQHELFPRLSVSMAYYRRNYYNFWREDNVLQSDGDYIPFNFTGPADPRLNEFAGPHKRSTT